MAQTFKNAKAVLADTLTDVYTCPANTIAIVIGCQVTNVGGSLSVLDFVWTDSSETDAVVYLGDGVSVPVASTYEPIGGKLVLEAGDKIRGLSSVASSLHATVSILEIS